MIKINKYFKTDKELMIYLTNWKRGEEYTGSFKTIEAACLYFEKQGLNRGDQDFINDSLDYNQPTINDISSNTSVSVNGSVNGGCKREVNFWLNSSNQRAISSLKQCNYKTPQKEIAQYLQNIFDFWPSSNKEHWLWISQRYTPRVINWVLSSTIKEYSKGGITKTPAHYFTFCIHKRNKRKCFRSAHDTYKKTDNV